MIKIFPADAVLVMLPGGNESTLITTADGQVHDVMIDESGRRVVRIPASDARMLINSGLPCCVPWRESDWTLAMNIADILPVGDPIMLFPSPDALERERLALDAWADDTLDKIKEDHRLIKAAIHGDVDTLAKSADRSTSRSRRSAPGALLAKNRSRDDAVTRDDAGALADDEVRRTCIMKTKCLDHEAEKRRAIEGVICG
jgi:hypothetical protein